MRLEGNASIKTSICLLLGLSCLLWAARAASSSQANASQPVETASAEPRIFAEGVISTSGDEFNEAFTPDGKSLYFTKSVVASYLYAICVSRFVNGQWATPEIAPFSGMYGDFDPFISPDGATLYFVSDRPAPGSNRRGNVDIWAVDKTATGWSEPRNLGAPVNSAVIDWYPSVTADGTLYFSSNRPEAKGFDIYRSRLVNGKYSEGEKLGAAINSEHAETEAYIAPDESFMIFISDRPGGQGHFDLYLSYRRDGAWTKAVNLGPKINSPGYDLSPLVAPDGKYFFFASDRGFATAPLEKRLTYQELTSGLRSLRNGLMNIYQVDVRALKLEH
jgi:Tol biopolymer transport system component